MSYEKVHLQRPDGQPVRALVVEDDPLLGELLTMALKAEGWDVAAVAGGHDALQQVREFQPDVVTMDVMIPGIDGVEVVRRLRARGDDVPVLFLTAKDELSDRLQGLTVGGDDYVTKPFSLEEVVLRLRAMVRRRVEVVAAQEDPLLTVGDLSLNPQTHEVFRAGNPIELTATEFALLEYLMENPRHVLSKAQILERVWEYDFGGNANVVEIYVSYLRKKLDAHGPAMIHTLRGVGYTIRPMEDQDT
ncbi:response regulator transcription factor [Actinomyces minihominis]|uniref:response regulator transcription factor n=1 Tax=Actinomyces minihominis TaxID=2002838 RepID=UPI000C07C854|nr:response regulator transcription factor [Actinomyces minihominis]